MEENFNNQEYKKIFWHSSAHILAAALEKIFGNKIKFGTGPAIENGFYYDVFFEDKDIKFDQKYYEIIEKTFLEIASRDDVFEKKNISKREAINFFEEKGNKFKIEIIKELNDGEITFYKNGDFIDLCKGPHLERSGVIKSVKILNVSGAFWRGNSNNEQMTRIYAISFPNEKMLEEYLFQCEKAKKSDHQKIGRELKLFCFSEKVGLGLPLWLPRGTVFRNILEQFLKQEQQKLGYLQVMTPHIGNINLYKTSGHYEKYGDDAFKPILTPNEGEEYFLKPMNCPHHCEIYKSEMRSYRDLPLRLAEFGTVYRYEQHGELNGLLRTRGFTQDDAHIFCRKNQVEEEISKIISLVKLVLNKLAFNNFRARLSLHDDKNFAKYIGSREDWLDAEKAIEDVARKNNLQIEKASGEAAFYGPKLDFIVKDSLGRDWQLGTIQLDYQLPIRFDLTYVNENNIKEHPIMIHRAPFGSIERITAIILEHTCGKLPFWLSPEQIIILPISEKVLDYSKNIFEKLKKENFRVIMNDRNEKLGKKILEAEKMKIPFFIIIGENEVKENILTVRKCGENFDNKLTLEAFLNEIKMLN